VVKTQSFGAFIKEWREKKGLPQRKLAQELDIDVAVLSRIENDKLPKKKIGALIKGISRLSEVREEDLYKMYLSDEIASLLTYEDDYVEVLKVSESKVNYKRSKKMIQSNINYEKANSD